MAYFKKHLNNRYFESPTHLNQYIYSKTSGLGNIVKCARVYLNFCEETERLPSEIIKKYRTVLKVPRSHSDYTVPSDEEMLINYNKVKNHSSMNIVYLVLATSGIRYVECLDFLKNYQIEKFSVFSNFVSYSLSITRHTKTVNNVYLPLFVYKQLKRVNNTYDGLRVRFKAKKCTFSPKYLRKWQYNFLLYNQVPESVADFIQGRSNKSVSANHYLAKAQQASFWYTKMATKLTQLFMRNVKLSKKVQSHSTIQKTSKSSSTGLF